MTCAFYEVGDVSRGILFDFGGGFVLLEGGTGDEGVEEDCSDEGKGGEVHLGDWREAVLYLMNNVWRFAD